MKILIVLGFLLGLLSCAEINYPLIYHYGGHTLSIHEDGSKSWTHPPDFVPIQDKAAHHSRAMAYVTPLSVKYCPNNECVMNLVKSDTLMGKGWILVKQYKINEGETVYWAFNMDNEHINGYHIPQSGEIDWAYAEDLNEVGNGVYTFDKNDSYLFGRYNFITQLGKNGFVAPYRNEQDGTTIFIRRYLPTGSYNPNNATSVDIPTKEEIGLGDFSLDNIYFSEVEDLPKDLEKRGLEIETDRLLYFGLSEEKEQKLARLTDHFSRLTSKRALTSRERDMFAEELIGMSFDKAAEMMVEDYEGLIEKAADHNETSPEAIKELINTIM